MYDRILVPLDGSPLAERVLDHLAPFATVGKTEVLLVRVISLAGIAAAPPGTYERILTLTTENMEQEATLYLDERKRELRALGYRVRTLVAEGEAASVICDLAEAHQVDMIAMSTHGRSGVSRWALGSVADHVVRVASKPVMLVRGTIAPPSHERLQRILLPLDGSPEAEKAVVHAGQIARMSGATVLLMRAIHLQTEPEHRGRLAGMERRNALRRQRGRMAQEYLARVQQSLAAQGVSTEIHVVQQPPAHAILTTAKREAVNLVIMRTHGRSGLRRLVYGSVANRILRSLPCPLILLREGEPVPAQRGTVVTRSASS